MNHLRLEVPGTEVIGSMVIGSMGYTPGKWTAGTQKMEVDGWDDFKLGDF